MPHQYDIIIECAIAIRIADKNRPGKELRPVNQNVNFDESAPLAGRAANHGKKAKNWP